MVAGRCGQRQGLNRSNVSYVHRLSFVLSQALSAASEKTLKNVVSMNKNSCVVHGTFIWTGGRQPRKNAQSKQGSCGNLGMRNHDSIYLLAPIKSIPERHVAGSLSEELINSAPRVFNRYSPNLFPLFYATLQPFWQRSALNLAHGHDNDLDSNEFTAR